MAGNYVYGSVPILMYQPEGSASPPPGNGFLLLTDLTNVLITDGSNLLTAGP